MSGREERIAENETRFREANEHIRAARERLEIEPPRETPFICECGDGACQKVIYLSLDEYERVRADANTFFVVPGHEDPATEQVVTGEVVHRNNRFAVVKKREGVRHVTEDADPRRA